MKTGALNPNQIKYPTWQLVEEKNLTEAATSVTFSGLAGNTDEMYMLNVRIINGYNGAVMVFMRLNDDGGANYGYQQLYGQNASVGAFRGGGAAFIVSMGSLPSLASMALNDLIIYAKSGYVRTLIHNIADGISGSTITTTLTSGQSWNNTADEITSLVILANQANGLGVGTYLALYKKVYS